MRNQLGRIRSTAPSRSNDSGAGDRVLPEQPDTSLPDPTKFARWTLFVLLLVSLALAVALNFFGVTAEEFEPSKVATANFALFAGFYVAAQVIERLMELVSPLLPWWPMPNTITDPTVKAAQIKSDRAKVTLGLASVAGVTLSCLLGLFFLSAIGMHVSHTVDSLVTGLVIAAGTKPLHDFLTLLQNKNVPATGTEGTD
jgi:hypothetical protein